MHRDADDHGRVPAGARVPRIGVGGPVGSGKTALVAALCRALSGELMIGVVTNDIYTTEDADFLRRAGVLPDERIRAVQTGACPHTAIRDDITANLDAVEQLEADHPGLDLILIESGGDNLTATFSYGLVHRQIFVIDVAGGDKVPRKGGPGVTRSDLLVINKTDLAPLVGADLTVMARDAAAARGDRPTLFTSLAADPLAAGVAAWVRSVRAAVAPVLSVIARARAVIEPGGVLGELACAPPVTLRQVRGEDRDRCELQLVATAAGPLAGDELSLCLELRPGARATLGATGASVAQGRGRGDGAVLSLRADLAEGADLLADPGALVVCHGAAVDVRLALALDAGARVEWHELIVLGRTAEPPGRATLRWDVTRLGRPVLRQFSDLSDAVSTWGRRVLASALICDPAGAPRTVVAGPAAVAQRVDDQTLLITVLGDDAASATDRLGGLCAQARG